MPKRINLRRKRFGKWYVLSYAGNSMWKCRCECGAIRYISGVVLRKGLSTQCKACKIESDKNKHVGKKIGYWKILSYESPGKYRCECTRCNTTYSVYVGNILKGLSKQCNACLFKYGRHGMSGTKYYRVWLNNKARHRFCDRWANSFLDFYEDTFAGYSDGNHIIPLNKNRIMSIDNYEWSKGFYSKGSAFVKIGGIVMSKSAWARHYGITRQGFEYRIRKAKKHLDNNG